MFGSGRTKGSNVPSNNHSLVILNDYGGGWSSWEEVGGFRKEVFGGGRRKYEVSGG